MIKKNNNNHVAAIEQPTQMANNIFGGNSYFSKILQNHIVQYAAFE